MNQVERTLAIIKPDAVSRHIAGEIITLIQENEFRIRGMKMLRLSRASAESFYAVHHGKAFYPGLIDFMTEGPVIVMVLEREDAIAKWRELMGATDPAKAAEGTIRRRYGTAVKRNCTHGSDSPKTARTEIAWFFAERELL